ncbi:MAG TPA: SDR family NAD(P)-dependent oxidoreductase [Pyrinomonadaceae bacterium]|nr:SDR family NAD(P)-dependent oxidoreductase [Pyrinomonadaceae bacterium]
MQLTGNTILITGGSVGIGYAMAERFASGNIVIVCGRDEEKLRAAAERQPKLTTRVCDVADPKERESLFDWATNEFPTLNVLVNNAGIQRRVDLTTNEDWDVTRTEIAINLDAPIHLSRSFYPHLSSQNAAAIINVTSGLSFVPLANVPIYCAAKAALHSFTLSLRRQLRDSPVEVIEIIPPAVNTDLGGPGLHTFGVDLDEFADAVFEGLAAGENEIAYGTALLSSLASADERTAIFEQLNKAFGS